MQKFQQTLIKTILILTGILNLISMNGQPMEAHKWKNRIIIVQATEKSSAEYQNQLKQFNGAAMEMGERKLVLYEIIGDKYRKTDFQKMDSAFVWQTAESWPRELVDHSSPFHVMLIGLDGGIKLKKSEILTKTQLFGLIDSMPMRRQEIKRKMNRRNQR